MTARTPPERRRGVKKRTKPGREDLKPGECLCDHCTAKCCRYFALPIDEPTTHEEYQYLRWFLFHDRAALFVEEGSWYLLVYTPCEHLGDDQRCRIYDRRPQICRDYSTEKCEYEDDWVYDHYFETAEQVEEYAEARLGPPGRQEIRSPQPDPLRVLMP
jgi:Fe-S-cluster containining protein